MLEEQTVPENIIAHSLLVAKISVFLADKLEASGIHVEKELVEAAALLHDLMKWEQIQNPGADHGELAYAALKDRYPEVALIVKKHMMHEIRNLTTWEEKLVHYADKRVNHDRLVSLEERFRYFIERYPPKDPDKRQEFTMLTQALEEEIFAAAGFPPSQLEDLMLTEG